MLVSHSLKTTARVCAFILAAGVLRAATIIESAPINFSVVDSGTGTIPLSAFNPALGTLTAVQLLVNVQVATTTQVTNETLSVDPLAGPLPVAVIGTANSTTVLMLSVHGFPISNAVATAPTLPVTIGPAQTMAVSTIAVSNDDRNVPSFEVSSFSQIGLVPLTFFAQEFYQLTTTPLGPPPVVGEVIQGPTMTDINGSIIAIYDYTPLVAAPEPSMYGMLAAGLIGFLAARVGRK